MPHKDQSRIIKKLEAIRKHSEGILTPLAVVKEALANPGGPLKDGFPDYFWDDKRCAHEHRIDLARKLIADVRIVTVDEQVKTIAAPYYVRDPKVGKEQGYTRLAEIKSDKEIAVEVLKEEFGRVIALLERALSVAEVIGLTRETNKLLERVRAIHEKIAA